VPNRFSINRAAVNTETIEVMESFAETSEVKHAMPLTVIAIMVVPVAILSTVPLAKNPDDEKASDENIASVNAHSSKSEPGVRRLRLLLKFFIWLSFIRSGWLRHPGVVISLYM